MRAEVLAESRDVTIVATKNPEPSTWNVVAWRYSADRQSMGAVHLREIEGFGIPPGWTEAHELMVKLCPELKNIGHQTRGTCLLLGRPTQLIAHEKEKPRFGKRKRKKKKRGDPGEEESVASMKDQGPRGLGGLRER